MVKLKSVNKERIEWVKKMRVKYSESQQGLWRDLAVRLDSTRKHRISVNVDHLNKLATRYPTKVLLVPGKVLGKGIFTQKSIVAAVSFTPRAKTEISKTGKAMGLDEWMESNGKASDVMIVK